MSNLKHTITEMIKHLLSEATVGEEEFAELEAAREEYKNNKRDDETRARFGNMVEKLVEPIMSEMGLFFEAEAFFNRGDIVFTNDKNIEITIDPLGPMGKYDVEVSPILGPGGAEEEFEGAKISLDSMKGVAQYVKDEFSDQLSRGGTYKQPPEGMVGEPEGQGELSFKESLNRDKLREMVSQAVVQELTFREQARVKKGTPVVYRRVEGPDFKERREYRGRWMGFTDKSKLDSMIEFDPGTGPDGSDFLRIETAELMLDN